MADVRIIELPTEGAPTPAHELAIDLSETRKITIGALGDVARPYASQALAIVGTDNATSMTPLTSAQQLAAKGPTLFASVAEGALAATALQHDDVAALAFKDQVGIPDINATGSPTSTTFLAGNGTWVFLPGGGNMLSSIYDPESVAGAVAFAATSATADQGALAETALQPTDIQICVQDLSAATIANSIFAIRTIGYATAGDGGEWEYAVEVENTGDLQPWQRQSNGATRRWELRSAKINVKAFGAMADVDAPAQSGLSAAWAYFRNFRYTQSGTLAWTRQVLVVPAGEYLITDTVDWTELLAWNLCIEANGAVFNGVVAGKPVVDMTDVRGLDCRGLSIYGDQTNTPICGLLVGPSATNVCGNNRFSGLKTDGFFGVAAAVNIGCETTRWDFCYFINESTNVGSFAFAGDAFCVLGVASNITVTRVAGTWASLTANSFSSCRFHHHGGQSDVYLDGVFNWAFDRGCYYVTWGTCNFTLRVRDTTQRITNVSIDGLFESTGPSEYGGLDDVVKIICDDNINGAIEGFILDMGQPHAKRSILRVETPAGTAMTTGVVKIRGAIIRMTRPIFTLATLPDFVTGGKLSIQGEINIARSDIINLDGLEGFQGTLLTTDFSQVTKLAAGISKPFSFVAFDETTESGRSVMLAGSSGNFAEVIAGATPVIKVAGADTDIGLMIAAKNAGAITLSSPTIASMPFQLPSYTKSTLPNAATYIRYLIVVSDATGGAALCRSNGTNWIDFHTKAVVA